MVKRATASFSPMTVVRMSLCISARSNAPGCIASMRVKRSLSRSSLIEGPANHRQAISAPLDVDAAILGDQRQHNTEASDALSRAYGGTSTSHFPSVYALGD